MPHNFLLQFPAVVDNSLRGESGGGGEAKISLGVIDYTLFLIRNRFIRSLHVEGQNIQRTYSTKNDIPNELFDLKDFYNCKHQELKKDWHTGEIMCYD